ncbi:unnamed protein product [Brugia timori]|uniref:Uncharacterized protein n=1 Tax=Brugia timori TaxID=42155 RepID=A0A3P7T6Q7_9BILA|nr:unnamed protein product [Brugia timori]
MYCFNCLTQRTYLYIICYSWKKRCFVCMNRTYFNTLLIQTQSLIKRMLLK